MSSHIPESDWRHFKRVHAILLERFCKKALEDLAAVIRPGKMSAAERHFRARDLLKKQAKELGCVFDDFRRSTAVMQLGIMRAKELLTDEELSVFSAETRQAVEGLAAIRRGNHDRVTGSRRMSQMIPD